MCLGPWFDTVVVRKGVIRFSVVTCSLLDHEACALWLLGEGGSNTSARVHAHADTLCALV